MSKERDTIINKAELVKLENRIKEECALVCERLGATYHAATYGHDSCNDCAVAIRERKKPEVSGD